MLQSSVETKTLPEIIEYYYFWKKYCPDEYRGRNRHVSEEVTARNAILCYTGCFNYVRGRLVFLWLLLCTSLLGGKFDGIRS